MACNILCCSLQLQLRKWRWAPLSTMSILFLLLPFALAENTFEQVETPPADLAAKAGTPTSQGFAPPAAAASAPKYVPRKRNVLLNDYRVLPTSRCELVTACLTGVGFVLIGSIALHMADKKD